jgi:hypothetical protein
MAAPVTATHCICTQRDHQGRQCPNTISMPKHYSAQRAKQASENLSLYYQCPNDLPGLISH